MYELWSFDRVSQELIASSEEPEDIMGFEAGPECLGLVIIDGDQRVVVTIDGSTALSSPSGGFNLGPTAIVSGLSVDIGRKTLGFPTAPERRDSAWFVTAIWLTEILDLAANPPVRCGTVDWRCLSRLHPCVSLQTVEPQQVGTLTRDFANTFSWSAMRSLIQASLIPNLSGLPLPTLKWMDNSMFARWMLSSYRPVTELLDDLSLFVSKDTHRALEAAATTSMGLESWTLSEGGQ